jgi:hypothetical protein
MRSGDIYRHKNCKDMDIWVKKLQYAGLEYIKVRIYYISQRTRDLFWETPETVKILRKDLKNWKRVTE